MTLNDLLNVPSEVEFEGQTYVLRPPDQLEQGLFSRWLEQRAREYVGRATDIPDAEADRLARQGIKAAAACEFEWGSDAYAEALQTPVGLAKMLFFILRTNNPGKLVTERLALQLVHRKIAEIAAVLEADGTEDPDRKKALLAAVGLPPGWPRSSDTSSSGSPTPRSASPSPKSPG